MVIHLVYYGYKVVLNYFLYGLFIGFVVIGGVKMTEREFLASYDSSKYEKPSVTVDMAVLGMDEGLDRLKLLLIKRGGHPYKGYWALAGGFMGMEESAYEAAQRELEEETGLNRGIYLEQVYTMSKPDRDQRMRVVDIAYMALIQEVPVVAGDDASEAAWFDVKFTDNSLVLRHGDIHIEYKLKKKVFKNGVVKIESIVPSTCISDNMLAFDHVDIIIECLMRLRNKVEYSDVAFNLMPHEFTLPDLQHVYEIILGRELYKVNFRSKMLGKVEPVGRKGKSIRGSKMSDLYRYAK